MKRLGLGLLILLSLSAQAMASEATLVVRLPGVSGATPSALDTETNKPIGSAHNSEEWSYDLDFGEGQILRRLRLTITGVQSPDMLSNLSINYPFFRKGDLLLVLTPPSNPGSGSDAARMLWATSVKDMSSDQLLEFYQRAKRVADDRTNDLAEDWENVHPYDVRSVFKYLEAAVALSRQLYIVPPDDVSKARDWLNGAAMNASGAVSSGVGLANASQLVKDLDDDEGRRFALIWSEIKEVQPCEQRKAYLDAYRKSFLKVGSDQQRERIVGVTGIPLAAIDSAIAQCVAILAKQAAATGTAEEKKAAKAELTDHIDSLQRTLDETKGRDLARKLNSDISVLSNMRQLF